MSEIAALFSSEGVLAQAVPGFRARSQQVDMAERIAAAIENNRVLVAEAGTGTGKTFAYLVPALRSGGKVIISTGTKTLQDQLFNRDLPTVRDALGAGVSISLLKGRANYVCPYHLEKALAAGTLATREEAVHLRKIARFAERTVSGDKAECIDVPEDSGAWKVATSTRENCLGQECPHHARCFVLAARQQALMSDVVVVNHHLFFADVMLKDDGMGELLPACNTVIFDEAHQLPEVAGLFFGTSLSTTQLIELARDVRNEGLASAKDYAPLQDAATDLDKAARDLRLAAGGKLDGARGETNQRLSEAKALAEPQFVPALATLEQSLIALARHLGAQAERGEGLANCLERVQDVQHRLKQWLQASSGVLTGDDAQVKWVELYSHALSLNMTPLDVAPIFQRQMEGHPRAWIFASATIAVGRDFSHYCSELGLNDAETQLWGSPFDYSANSLLYSPLAMPDPNSAQYQDAVVEAVWPALRAAGQAGCGSFVLCTSLRAMRRIHELLAERLAGSGLEIPLLLQGDSSRSQLLDRFRLLGNAILVASQSFWEGVDVRGTALSLVVIDKLPFAPPDDPVLAARIERLREAGRNPFMDYQLPRTVISMKQGAGRLIRDEQDRGVLIICDPRLTGKPYGRRVWQSLPAMRRTRDVAEVEAFFASP
jgi:ATP-dependent DNA helicase DinG